MLTILASTIIGIAIGQYIKVDIDSDFKNAVKSGFGYAIDWLLDAYTTVKIAIKSEAPTVINTEFDAIELQHRKQKASLNI